MEETEVSRNRCSPGRREREAGKRHRRARVLTGTLPGWLKLGREHFRRWTGFSMIVADTERVEHTSAGDRT